MPKSIRPKTMRDVWKKHGRVSSSVGLGAGAPSKLTKGSSTEISTSYKGKVYEKPREWQYITKPFFKRIKEPIVDVFKEAEEIQIIIDLGNFTKGELDFKLKQGKYCIFGKHGDCEFYKEIPLPKGVDTKKIKEMFRNNILELTIPKKTIEKRGERK